MRSRYVLPAIGMMGLLFAVGYAFSRSSGQEATPNQLNLPPVATYASSISGTGIIEANSRNIDVGSFLSGVTAEVMVVEGQMVKKGDALFALDDRAARAEMEARQKDVASAAARVETAKVQLADDEDQLRRVESLKVGVAVSEDRLQRVRFVARKSAAALRQAQAELESAKAMQQAAQVTFERLTIRAPIDGRILKVRARPGEFVTAGGEALILMGNDTPLNVRVTVDENDVWRFSQEAKAEAALRSNKDIKVSLNFVRVEPYVLPKKNLSGNSAELVDTRVLEVVYEIAESSDQLFIGQQMDVFIEVMK